MAGGVEFIGMECSSNKMNLGLLSNRNRWVITTIVEKRRLVIRQTMMS